MKTIRLLVISAGTYGDFLLSMPAVTALAERFPQATVEVMGRPEVIQLAVADARIARLHSIDDPTLSKLFVPRGQLQHEAAQWLASFDLAVSWFADSDGVFASNLTAAGVSRLISASPYPPEGTRTHVAEHLMGTLGPLGIDGSPRPYTLALTDKEKSEAVKWLHDNGIDRTPLLVAVHPGSGGRAKCWPAERFAEAAQRIGKKWRAQFLVPCGEADEWWLEDFERAADGLDYVLARELGIRQLAALLAACDVYLGNDSGVTHLAAAVDTPTVAVFGPTDPSVWAPLGHHVHIAVSDVECAPCDRTTRNSCTVRSCLASISVDRIIDEVRDLIEKNRVGAG